MTGPKVLRGRETSMLWFGISGVWMARGVLGMTPKLGEKVKKSQRLIRRQDLDPSLGFNGFLQGNIIFNKIKWKEQQELRCPILICCNTGYHITSVFHETDQRKKKHSAAENWLGNGLMLKFSYVYHATRGAGLINIFFYTSVFR